jgi:hypothetical protein
MKKLTILMLAIGLFSLYSCKKDETKVVLSTFNPAQVLTPPSGSAYVLTKDYKDSLLFNYTWAAAAYNLTDQIVPPTYTVEMDTAGGNFSKPTVVATTKNTTYPMNVGTMNNLILGIFNGIPDQRATFQFRVRASLVDNAPAANNISPVITLDITPYTDVVTVAPIYMLGDATDAGWDNTKALRMTHIGTEGQYAIVGHLLANKMVKFIADSGFWEPMWGLGATGTWEGGDLKYRKVGEPDPPAIPSPTVEGDYYIMADTANLVYEVSLTSSQLYLVGAATTAGWTPANGIAFTKVSPGIFTLTTTLTAGGMKILETTTGWAPQWGTDATGTGNFGPLLYRPTESVPDPAEIPSPGAGTFTIDVNLATKAYKISAAK